MAEQGKASAALAREGDEVRRIARQTARAVAEQADAIASLSTGLARHAAAMATILQATREQSGATDRIVQAIGEMRGRARGLGGALGEHLKGADAVAKEAAQLLGHLARIREVQVEQAEAVAAAAAALGEREDRLRLPQERA
jgi:methyl-accepting chemotaxis protein